MVTLKHTKVSGKADGVDATVVRPSDWNAEHKFETSAAAVVLGRAVGAGPGAVQELPMGTLFPVGSIIMFGGDTAPTGWLICDGQNYNQATHPGLFAVVANKYGTAPAGQFLVPNMQGRVPAGRDVSAGLLTAPWVTPNGSTLGAKGGVQAQAMTIAQMPGHGHVLTDPGHAHNIDNGRQVDGGSGDNTFTAMEPGEWPSNVVTDSHATGITMGSTGGGAQQNNLQPTMILNFIIKDG